MRLLLDTHILLWAILDDPHLGDSLRSKIGRAEAIFVSAATVWEVAIKAGLGKLDVPDDLFDRALAAGAQPLQISWLHAKAVQGLPLHHADPFDRMLIAQASCENLSLVSIDAKFREYDISLIDA